MEHVVTDITTASTPSSTPRVLLRTLAKGKVDTGAFGTRGVRTYRYIAAAFLLATTLRLVMITVEEVRDPATPVSAGMPFLALSVLSLWMGINQVRRLFGR